MDWMNKVGGILQQYSNPDSAPNASNVNHDEVNQHFDNVAQSVPSNILAQGVSAALNSNSTPPFGQTIGDLFNRSNPDQKSGVLNQLISALGPGAASILASNGLSGILGGSGQVNPQAASQVSPDTVTQLANQAQKQNPSIVDTVSGFYAQHPTLVKSLGVAALSIVMSRMSQRAA
jgi:hypothetical protein